jgi:hypothetical protein
MKTNLRNDVDMLKTVNAYLADHNAIWGSMAPLAAAVAILNTGLAAINATAQDQETPTGDTLDKAAARDALEEVLFLMCQALSVLAHNASDNDLVVLTDVTPTTLDRMDGEALSNRAARVLDAANARQTELTTLHVTPANILELESALQNFNSIKATPRTRAAARKAQTASLASQTRDLKKHVRHTIDPMVNLFRRTNPDFVAGYRAARVIINRVATHSAKPSGATTPTAPITPTTPHTP